MTGRGQSLMMTVIAACCACHDEPGLRGVESALTVCDIDGPVAVCPDQLANYTYSTDISDPTITWIVTSGAITLAGQGDNTATFSFGGSFAGGSIQAVGEGQDVCSDTLYISAISEPRPPTPTITARLVSGPGEPTDYSFTATEIPGATYNWYVNGVLQQSGPSKTFDWYFQCKVSKTVKCVISNACYTSGFSNAITRTGGCERT